MTPADLAADSLASWRYAIACLRAAVEADRDLTTAELVERADAILAAAAE